MALRFEERIKRAHTPEAIDALVHAHPKPERIRDLAEQARIVTPLLVESAIESGWAIQTVLENPNITIAGVDRIAEAVAAMLGDGSPYRGYQIVIPYNALVRHRHFSTARPGGRTLAEVFMTAQRPWPTPLRDPALRGELVATLVQYDRARGSLSARDILLLRIAMVGTTGMDDTGGMIFAQHPNAGLAVELCARIVEDVAFPAEPRPASVGGRTIADAARYLAEARAHVLASWSWGIGSLITDGASEHADVLLRYMLEASPEALVETLDRIVSHAHVTITANTIEHLLTTSRDARVRQSALQLVSRSAANAEPRAMSEPTQGRRLR